MQRITTFWKTLTLAAAVFAVSLTVPQTARAVSWGTSAEALTWDTLTTASGIFTNFDGVENVNPGGVTESASYNDGRASSMAMADISGLVPLLKGISTPLTTQTAGSTHSVGIIPLLYSGPNGATLTLNLQLTGDLNRPGDTWASINGTAMLLEEDIDFTQSLSDFYELGGLLDDTSFGVNLTDANLNLTDSISTTVDNGDIIHVAMSLGTNAGWTPAYADAYSTFTGNITLTAGQVTSGVPEPASIAVIGLGCLVLLRRRR